MTLLYHWRELGLLGALVAAAVALQVFLPGVLPAVLRWVLGTEWGRALLVIVLVCLGWWAFRDHYVAAGRAAVLAEQAQANREAATRQAFATLDAYMAGAQAQAVIGAHLDAGYAETLAARDRTIACLRDGSCQLRHRFACPAVGPVAGPGPGGDGAAPAGFAAEDAAAALGIAADGDAAIHQLTACQAVVREYQRIGRLCPALTH